MVDLDIMKMNKTLSTIMPIVLFLCGNVMTGRGIDQILLYPSNPALHEPHVKDARDYIALAENQKLGSEK